MLQLKYQDDFIDMSPGDGMEIERTSPLFLIDESLAEYSTPVNIIYSNGNAKVFSLIYQELSVRNKIQLDVDVYINGTYRCAGTLIIETAVLNRVAGRTSLGGYLLTGISSFFYLVKDTLCQDLPMTDEFNQNFTTGEPYDNTNGYWQQLHNTWNGDKDFVVAPVRNAEFYNLIPVLDADDSTYNPQTGFQNLLYFYTSSVLALKPYQRISPFLKVKVAFEKILAAYGWTLDSSLMTDADWTKLIIYNSASIDTALISNNGGGNFVSNWKGSLQFKYTELLPLNTKASSFILAICKRYGWAPLCNSDTRTCTLVALKNVDDGALKDWTIYAERTISSSFADDEKLYAYKNNFTGSDTTVNDADLSQYNTTVKVNSFYNLPAATADYDNYAIYCWLENEYYTVIVDQGNRMWSPYKGNIYNDEPAGNNAAVETDCTTLNMVYSFIPDPLNYLKALVPFSGVGNNSETGVRTLIYHGMFAHMVNVYDGTMGNIAYPYASSIRTGLDGNELSQWSNTWHHATPDTDKGIVRWWLKKWISYMKYAEVTERYFYLPLHELLGYKWTDIILLQNIPHLLMSYIENLTRPGMIKAKLKRLITEYTAEDVPPPVESEDAHWTEKVFVSGDASFNLETIRIKGVPNSSVTFRLYPLTNPSGGSLSSSTLKVDGVVAAENNEYTYSLDANGYTNNINMRIDGTAGSGEIILGRFTIISVTDGNIGTPAEYQTSKVF